MTSQTDGETVEALEPPDADSVEVDLAMARLQGRLFKSKSSVPKLIGRYRVDGVLGSGGCGVVYRAYDPELDRPVAIKVIVSSSVRASAATMRKRLLREARAMAATSHPNVVDVFDVGTVGDDEPASVFIAMELVDGTDLREWLSKGPHPREEILRVFVEAGRGLQQAHAVGLTHRDFKPSNVLIGKDGRVRVVDFGLARATSAMSHDASQPSSMKRRPTDSQLEVTDGGPRDSLDSEPAAGVRLTETGTVLGTPAYMAPEQWHAEASGPRSDQFSFCVSLCEALVGRRPQWCTDRELSHDEASSVLETLDGPAVPPQLHPLLSRGLSFAPEDRYPSMQDLLDDLEKLRPAPSGASHWGWIAAGVTLVGLGAMLLLADDDDDAVGCRDAPAALGPTWSPQQRKSIQQAMLQTNVRYANRAWTDVSASLDAYVEQWTSTYAEVCREAGAGAPHEFDLRMSCLRRARVDLDAALEVLARSDPEIVARAHDLVAGLPPAVACQDASQGDTPRPLPPVGHEQAVEEAQAMLAEARARFKVAEYGDALEVLERARTQLEDVDFPPLWAEIELERGYALRNLGRNDEAVAAFSEVMSASDARALRSTMRIAAVELMFTVGMWQGEIDEALEKYEPLARRLAEGDLEAEAHFSNARGSLLSSRGDHIGAEAAHRRALELRLRIMDPTASRVATTRLDLAVALTRQGKLEEAEASFRQALADREAVHGTDHPLVGVATNALASLLYVRGQYDEAEGLLRRSLQIRSEKLGPDHPEVASSHDNLANVLTALGRYDEAEKEHRIGLDIRNRALPPAHPELAISHNNLCTSLRLRGRALEAERECRTAIEMWTERFGEQHDDVATGRNNLAEVLCDQQRYDEAEALARRALAQWRRNLGPQHPNVGFGLTTLACPLAATGRMEEAKQLHQQALELLAEALGPAHPQVVDIQKWLDDHG